MLALIGACGPASSPTALIEPPAPAAPRPGPIEPEHDFGTVLATGQDLHHEFELHNPGPRPIRLVSAEALTPCCSSVGPLPPTIEPGGTARLPVVLQATRQAGLRRVEFVVRTDDPVNPGWVVAVRSLLVPDFEFDLVSGEPTVLLGEGMRRTYRLTSRRPEANTAGASTVEAAGLESARFIGPALERRNGPLAESVQEIEAVLPPSATEGMQRGDLIIRWDDGSERIETVTWSVAPVVRIEPTSLLLGASDEPTREVTLRSAADPVRITGIRGPARLVDSLPTSAERVHVLKLAVDTSRLAPQSAADVVIELDHPIQRSVTLTVLGL